MRKYVKGIKTQKNRQTASVDVAPNVESTRISIARQNTQGLAEQKPIELIRCKEPDEVIIKKQEVYQLEDQRQKRNNQKRKTQKNGQSSLLLPPSSNPTQLIQNVTEGLKQQAILPDLQASLQAIRSAKQLIDQQVIKQQTISQNSQTRIQNSIQRTNSSLGQSTQLHVIKEKFTHQHASVGSLLHMRQPSTTRNNIIQQSQQEVSQQITETKLQEAKLNILKQLPHFENQRGSVGTIEIQHAKAFEKSKIIVDLTNSSGTQYQSNDYSLQQVKLPKKPPIGAVNLEKQINFSPKKGRNNQANQLGVSLHLQGNRKSVESPEGGALRHCESQKVIAGMVEPANIESGFNGISSRHLPQIRPSHEELRQNSQSMMAQNDRKKDHLEQLRYFAALRQKKQNRHNYNSVQQNPQRQAHPQSSGYKKSRKMIQNNNYHSLERQPAQNQDYEL